MCGLVGFLGRGGVSSPDEVLRRMTNAITHRGPDSDGYWLDMSTGIALGHRRLAIVDLSPAGAQPMASASSRWVIAFNGEIYNHLDLRAELENAGATPGWRGHSDTETLLAGFDAWGVDVTLKKCVGMFAIAAWCRQSQTLVLARDRMGEKPLYYGWLGTGEQEVLLFGSELKALRKHPAFNAAIDPVALGGYMRQMAVAGTQSIYAGVHKVPPGTVLCLSPRSREVKRSQYWCAAEVAQRGVAQPFEGSASDAADELERLLKHAVKRQMMADVPLGAFLSGGVDSSTVVALMQAQSRRPIKTFTVGFVEESYNEAGHAKVVARHLGTDHTELYITPQQAMGVIPRLASIYDEPFADSSQIPTYLVSEMTRRHVTVGLSGDAGDELFCGYNRYQLTASYWHKLEKIPRSLRRAIGWGITRFPPHQLDRWAYQMRLTDRWAGVGDKLHKGASAMSAGSVGNLYDALVAVGWADPAEVVLGLAEGGGAQGGDADLSGLSEVERMMTLDMLRYLPDDILTKVDRAAMAVSLETRVPFLDHQVIEFAWTLPLRYKLREEHGRYITKSVLRDVLYRYVPQNLIERPKMGFGVQLEHWLRGPLRDWAEDLLSEHRLKADGYLDPMPIRKKWAEHLSGQRNWLHPLWCVLMFQTWLTEQRMSVL